MEYDIKYLQAGFFGRIWQRLQGFFKNTYAGFFLPKRLLEGVKLSTRDKASVASAYIVPGLGHLLQSRIEKSLCYLAFTILYFWYLFTVGVGAFTKTGIFAQMQSLGIAVTVVFTLLFFYIYPKSVTDTVTYIAKLNKNLQTREKSVVIRAFKALGLKFSVFCEKIISGFKNGSGAQKAAIILGFTLPGISALFLRQFIKGIIKIAISAAFVLYFIMRGANDILGFFTLHTEGVKSNYNIVFGLIALFITIAFIALYIANIVYSVNAVSKQQKGEALLKFTTEFKRLFNQKMYILFLSIPICGVLLFTILPLIYMISIAFTNFATTETLGVIPNTVKDIYLSWTGFTTFIKLFTLSNYFKAFADVLGWTLIWAFAATFTCYFGGLLLAMLINKKIVKCKTLFRSLFVLSMAVPQLVTLRVMYAMFHDYGPINSLLLKWNIISERILFWGNINSAKTLIILINMWVGIPYFMLLMSGLLISIPQDLYEYAKVEGAGRLYVFRKITMPYLLFMTMPLLITNFVSNINNFNVIWLLTGGGPGGQGTGGVAGGTDILITWLYKLTMQHNPDYNIGSAIGIIMFIISAGLSLIIYRNSSSYKREGDFS